MKVVRKKSVDTAANKMIVAAYRKGIDLAWDRSDAMQPQCGFSRMGICCDDCFDGPCRINPFDDSSQLSICGRGQSEMIKNHFLKKMTDGAASLVGLALDYGAQLNGQSIRAVLSSNGGMLSAAQYDQQAAVLGNAAIQALDAIHRIKSKQCGPAHSDTVTVNLGVLQADTANVVLHGHIDPQTIGLLVKAAAQSRAPIHITAMCGAEFGLPIVTNYQSQELPLLTGAVDMLVVGAECVMPATVSLAKERNVQVVCAKTLTSLEAAVQALSAANEAFNKRGQTANIPDSSEKISWCWSAEKISSLLPTITSGQVKGIVYFSGCGNSAHTQDAGFIKLANDLISEKYLIVATGCAGAALAKAGLCHSDRDGAWPPVLYMGSCQDAGEFLQLVPVLKKAGLEIMAVMPEITHNKILITAVGFASAGIPAYIGLDEALAIPAVNLTAPLLPLADFWKIDSVVAEVAATK